MKKLMTGNEAVARGAYEAGALFASAYPGTPSTEILENITTYKQIISEWAPNEKVAMEAAAGAAIAGARSIVSMKHVGVNVAADPLLTMAYTGVNGGLVVITADEPGQHSSQNEQDNRYYATLAKLPMLEPSDSAEAKEMTKAAFALSEEYDSPIFLRMTTRTCHSKGAVECADRVEAGVKPYVKNAAKYVMVPANAKVRRLQVKERMEHLAAYSEDCPWNFAEYPDTKIGVISSGMCYNYAKEVFGDGASYLKLGFTNPLPAKLIADFCAKVDKIYVIEENDPYIEDFLKAQGIACQGKDTFPCCGEKTPDVIRKALYGKTQPILDYNREKIVPRPPTLCAGCPHRGFFYDLSKRKDIVVAGDIGCYTLGFAPPYSAMDWCICMGGSFSTGHGAQKIFNLDPENKKRVVAVLGDSTFFHTGVNSLLEVVYNGSNTVSVILDNRITGMTGHQQNPGTGYTAGGDPANQVDMEALVRACGIRNLRAVNPNDLAEMKSAMDWALSLEEPSVIITKWPCVLKRFSAQDKEEFPGAFTASYTVGESACIGCKICLGCGCPALSFQVEDKKAVIDSVQCVGCGICAQTCPKHAIVEVTAG